jgi:hypothetical protein
VRKTERTTPVSIYNYALKHAHNIRGYSMRAHSYAHLLT